MLIWSAVRCLVLDVDGVLTDGSLYYGARGECLKRFYVRDGLGIKRLLAAGIQVAVISGKKGKFTSKRLDDLGVKEYYLGVENKLEVYEALKVKLGICEATTAYIGDDLVDIALIKRVAFGIAVADAEEEVKLVAKYITKRPGGWGAVREIADLILCAKNI